MNPRHCSFRVPSVPFGDARRAQCLRSVPKKGKKSTNLICPTFVRGPDGEIFLLSHKKLHVRACASEDDEGGQGRKGGGELLFTATVSFGCL